MKSSIEHSFREVRSIMYRFADMENENSWSEYAKLLEDIHDVPEIGIELLKEERSLLQKISLSLHKKDNLTYEEQEISYEVEDALVGLDCSIKYYSGQEKIASNFTLKDNFLQLKAIDNDSIYQSLANDARDKVQELFNNSYGNMPGTIKFHEALNALYGIYMYGKVMGNIDKKGIEDLENIIMDIAKNINVQACDYLIAKDNVFKSLI